MGSCAITRFHLYWESDSFYQIIATNVHQDQNGSQSAMKRCKIGYHRTTVPSPAPAATGIPEGLIDVNDEQGMADWRLLRRQWK